jgi:hypothetical protein
MLEGYANIPPFYSVASDASNQGHTKPFPIALKYWTPEHGVESKFLDIYDDPDETSAGISQQIKKVLLENSLSIDNISSYSGDNASVNFATHSSFFRTTGLARFGSIGRCVRVIRQPERKRV